MHDDKCQPKVSYRFGTGVPIARVCNQSAKVFGPMHAAPKNNAPSAPCVNDAGVSDSSASTSGAGTGAPCLAPIGGVRGGTGASGTAFPTSANWDQARCAGSCPAGAGIANSRAVDAQDAWLVTDAIGQMHAAARACQARAVAQPQEPAAASGAAGIPAGVVAAGRAVEDWLRLISAGGLQKEQALENCHALAAEHYCATRLLAASGSTPNMALCACALGAAALDMGVLSHSMRQPNKLQKAMLEQPKCRAAVQELLLQAQELVDKLAAAIGASRTGSAPGAVATGGAVIEQLAQHVAMCMAYHDARKGCLVQRFGLGHCSVSNFVSARDRFRKITQNAMNLYFDSAGGSGSVTPSTAAQMAYAKRSSSARCTPMPTSNGPGACSWRTQCKILSHACWMQAQ